MQIFPNARCAFALCGAAALLAACGGVENAFGAPAPPAQSHAPNTHSTVSYNVVYSFSGGSDGAYPVAGLIDVGGTLYGTTKFGGKLCAATSTDGGRGCGTVFSATPDGTETVLHAFAGKSDGALPYASLLDVAGTLYGTTGLGGRSDCYSAYNYGCGTVFSITPTGVETVLHAFSPYEGWFPAAPLIDVNGTLYGTTVFSDDSGDCFFSTGVCGTVFSMTTAGQEKELHDFAGRPDGSFPMAGLIDAGGTLYGTAQAAGKHGWGIVFSITTGGKENILHSFQGPDGSEPEAGLVALHGKFYGTTATGGGLRGCGARYGCGTVFRISHAGVEEAIHSFGESGDGAQPEASLIVVRGLLYGTTQIGGAYNAGTVFSITPDGTETVLHSFGNGEDGADPQASLINIKGTLYGTTSSGGAHRDGTLFSLKP